MTTTIIRGGRIIDPSQGLDQVADLVIRGGLVSEYGENINADADNVIDANGKIVCPGLIDIHVSLREPGFEEDETTASGTAAALAGGFTSIGCMPDTNPVVDNRASAEFVKLQAERAGNCHVFPLGTVTKERGGKELSEIGQLVQGGTVAFTDGHQAVSNPEVMRRALEYTSMFDRTILNMPIVAELAGDGVMYEGFVSTLLGLQGIPAAAHDIMVGRDIALAEMTGGRIHVMCLTTTNGVEQVRAARRRGVRITAEVTPHHLALTDDTMKSFGSEFKVEPPLVPQQHIDALIEGLKDGTIEVLCSDHTPLASQKTKCEIDLAPPGICALETALPVAAKVLVGGGHLNWPELIRLFTVGPASVLGIDKGTLKLGTPADVTVFDPDSEWKIDPGQFRSHSRNTPFAGMSVTTKVRAVLVDGRVAFSDAT